MSVLIQYIGRQKNRPDDVLKTQRKWKENGSVVEVDDTEAKHYLQHPMEWRSISKEDYASYEQRMEQAREASVHVTSKLAEYSLEQLMLMRGEFDAEVRRRQSKLGAPVDQAVAVSASSEPVVMREEAATHQAAADRIAQIRTAISEMDQRDPEQFAKHPRPMWRVAAVSERVGFKVTQNEILEAMANTAVAA